MSNSSQQQKNENFMVGTYKIGTIFLQVLRKHSEQHHVLALEYFSFMYAQLMKVGIFPEWPFSSLSIVWHILQCAYQQIVQKIRHKKLELQFFGLNKTYSQVIKIWYEKLLKKQLLKFDQMNRSTDTHRSKTVYPLSFKVVV